MNNLVREGKTIARNDRLWLVYSVRIPSDGRYRVLGSLIDVIVGRHSPVSNLYSTSDIAGRKQDLKSGEAAFVWL